MPRQAIVYAPTTATEQPMVDFVDQMAAVKVALEVNGNDPDAPVRTWIHPDAHVWPPSTSNRMAAFFQEHTRR